MIILDRTQHNLWAALLSGTGKSYNDISAYMDRFAKTARANHREVGGHDTKALIEMIVLFQHKYQPMEIFKAWLIHKIVDQMGDNFSNYVKSQNDHYGRKDNIIEEIYKLEKKMNSNDR